MIRFLRPKLLVALALLLALVAGFTLWVSGPRDSPSYESAFVEFIWLSYPAGISLASFQESGEKIDSVLREREAGYLAGVTSRGDPPEVVEVELAVDLDLEAGKSLVEEFKVLGVVPEEIETSGGSYPRSDLVDEVNPR